MCEEAKLKVKIGTIAITTIVILIMAFVFRNQINNGLSCLAYYEQCTAKRIDGLTNSECLKRGDAVAYLIEERVCLVSNND